MSARSGVLERDERWDGEVLVDGDVVVPAGVTLRLAPGCRVSFAGRPRWSCAVFRPAPEGYPVETSNRELCDLVVLGRLIGRGTAVEPVVLGADDAPWGGLVALDRGVLELSHARLRPSAEHAIQAFDDARALLSSCVVERAEVGLWAMGFSRVEARGCELRASRCGAQAGEAGRLTLLATRVEGSPQGCAAQDYSSVEARGCVFAGTRDFGLSLRGRAYARSAGCRQEPACPTLVEDDACLREEAPR